MLSACSSFPFILWRVGADWFPTSLYGEVNKCCCPEKIKKALKNLRMIFTGKNGSNQIEGPFDSSGALGKIQFVLLKVAFVLCCAIFFTDLVEAATLSPTRTPQSVSAVPYVSLPV